MLRLLALLATAVPAFAQGFEFKDTPGDHLDVLLDGKTAARYMYAHDAAKRDLTYKPYLHVFDAAGKAPITKGPGGQFPHHRGIFVGWNKIGFDGRTIDRWHMKGGDIVHEKFVMQKADKDFAAFTSVTHWLGEDGKAFVEEKRTHWFRKPAGAGRLIVGCDVTLAAPLGDVKLDGDPEHAGVQFRPANEVEAKATAYTFPGEMANPSKDVDYPWVGETFTLAGNRHSVVMFNPPGNPRKTRFSAYRDYGRFGAFPVAEIKKGESLALHYGFLIADGEMPDAPAIQKAWDDFAGVKEPTPSPKTTVLPVKK